MAMPISPWAGSAQVMSPDRTHVAQIPEAYELAMGAPTVGRLLLDGKEVPGFSNPSLVWSDDSNYLAIPQWADDRRQRLLIVRLSPRESRFAPGIFRVLELHSFDDGIIRGIDSPIHMPKEVAIEIRTLNWTK